jgi:hypothetical protein
MRRYLLLLIVILAVAAVVAAGYFLRVRGIPFIGNSGEEQGDLPAPGGAQVVAPPPAPVGSFPAGSTGETPPASATFGLVAEAPAVDYFVDVSGTVTLVQPDGQIVSVAQELETAVSASPIASLVKAAFSFDGKKVLVVFGERGALQLSVFDVPGRFWQPLSFSGKIQDIVWSPNDHRILYLIENGGAVALATVNVDDKAAKPRELARLQVRDALLQWTHPDVITIASRPSALITGSVWTFNPSTRTLKVVVQGAPGAEVAWDVKGDNGVLFESSERGGGTLSIIERGSGATRALGMLTLPEKCVFREEKRQATSAPAVASLFCAVPRTQDAFLRNTMPDAYLKRALYTEDDFFAVDVKTQETRIIFSDSTRALDAVRLKVFQNALFFINRYDQRVYAISL